MTKQSEFDKIKQFFVQGSNCPYRALYIFGGKFTLLDKRNYLKDLEPDQIEGLLSEYPELPVTRFVLAPVWSWDAMKFVDCSNDPLPEILKDRKIDTVSVDSRETAQQYVCMIQSGEGSLLQSVDEGCYLLR